MCGICGVFDRSVNPLTSCLEPDEPQSFVTEAPTETVDSLIRRSDLRTADLSIIDIEGALAAHWKRGRNASSVVFNGEIYNFVELRKELESAGHRFHDPIGHRGDRPCLRAMGRRLCQALQWNVRLRDLGRA